MIKLSKNSQKQILILGIITAIAVILFVIIKPEATVNPVLSESPSPQAAINSVATVPSISPVIADNHAHVVDNQAVKTEADIRYKKLLDSMSQSVSELTEAEKQIAIDKILSELPLVVRDGKMTPINAVFAHTTLLERQNIQIDAAMIQELESKYNRLYPHDDKAPRSEHDLE